MKKLYTTYIFLIIVISSFANGGVVRDGCFTKGTTSITLLNEEQFKLNSEHLFIHIEENYVTVKAIYWIENKGEAKDLKYGFAVDYIGKEVKQDNSEYSWKDEYVKDFQITSNSKELDYYIKNEEKVRSEKAVFARYDSEPPTVSISRKWFISELSFGKGEIKQLVVTYKLMPNYADWLQGAGDTYYNPRKMSDRLFQYYLKNAN